MKEKQLRALINVTGGASVIVETVLDVHVTILDVRSAYGRLDALVRPVAGAGSKWVSAERITKR